MAKQTLPVNYVNDTLASAMNGLRRYRQINNADGTVSFEDVTDYDVVGNDFGATQLNATNQAVNESADKGKIIDDIDVIGAVTEEGYIAGALALKKVNESLKSLYELDSESKIRISALEKQSGTYTFDSIGILYIICGASAEQSSYLYASSNLFGATYVAVMTPANSGTRTTQYHINKGDTLTVTSFRNSNSMSIWFVPYK